MTEPRFINCLLEGGRGRTDREAEVVFVPGSALMGPTDFPVLRPMLNAGERSRFLVNLGWVITPGKRR